MANKKKVEKVRKGFAISVDVNKQLEEYALQTDLTQNQIANMALAEFFQSRKIMRMFSNFAGADNNDFAKLLTSTLTDDLKEKGLVVPSDQL